MYSTSTSSNGTPTIELSKQDYNNENNIISTSSSSSSSSSSSTTNTTPTVIIPSNGLGQHSKQQQQQQQLSCSKRNKLPDSLIVGGSGTAAATAAVAAGGAVADTTTTGSGMSTTARSLHNHPTLTSCIKGPPIIAAVHHHHQHQHNNHHQQQQLQQQRQYLLQKQSSGDSNQDTGDRQQDHHHHQQQQQQHSSFSLAPSSVESVQLPMDTPKSLCCTAIKANAPVNPLITQKMSRTIPSDKINLRLILVSGKTKEFLFNPTDSAGDIAQTVFENWPTDWSQEAVAKAEILRLIYQGRFLHCNVTLGALGLPLGKTTVMHLVPRDNLPEPNSQDQRQKSKGGSGRCCSTTCCIL